MDTCHAAAAASWPCSDVLVVVGPACVASLLSDDLLDFAVVELVVVVFADVFELEVDPCAFVDQPPNLNWRLWSL